MNVSQIQAALNARGHNPPLTVDGVPGRKTTAAVDALLAADKAAREHYRDWSDARRLVAVEQIIYRDLRIQVGAIDGLVGEQTRYAREVAKARADNGAQPDPKVEAWRDGDPGHAQGGPTPVRAAVWPRQSECAAFFGKPGTNHETFEFPFPMRLAWEPSTNVFRTTVNRRVIEPLKRIWKRTLDHYGIDELRRLRLDMFGGCYNNRTMRGGSALSMHAYAIAWDVDPDRNQLKWHRSLANLDDPPYAAFWSFVEDEGAISLGRARNYDWMHFQFARL